MNSENDAFASAKEKTINISDTGSNSDEPQAKRNVRDSVFTHLFRDKRYLLQLYKALHPEDGSATEEDLVNITIDNVLVEGQYNDLGFLVGDRIMVLTEAQSTWSVNVVIRGFLYLAYTLQKYCDLHKSNLYGSKKVCLPRMELYVIYTGDRRKRPDELSLTEEFFDGKKCAVDVTVKMIYGSMAFGNDGEEDIIGQYVNFCRIYTEQYQLYGRTRQTITETIRICRECNVLKEYLESRETEVMTMIEFVYNQDRFVQIYYENKLQEDLEREVAKMAEEVTRSVAEEVTRSVTEEVTRSVTEEVTRSVTEEVTRNVTEEVTRDVVEKTRTEGALKMLREGKLTIEQIAFYQDLPLNTVRRLNDELLTLA